jgi:hypothetical protein
MYRPYVYDMYGHMFMTITDMYMHVCHSRNATKYSGWSTSILVLVRTGCTVVQLYSCTTVQGKLLVLGVTALCAVCIRFANQPNVCVCV